MDLPDILSGTYYVLEGKLEEIVSCEETEKGVLIRTEKESMMIYCGKKEKREELLERLGSRAA